MIRRSIFLQPANTLSWRTTPSSSSCCSSTTISLLSRYQQQQKSSFSSLNTGSSSSSSSSSSSNNNEPIESTNETMANLAANIPPRFMKWTDFESLCQRFQVSDSRDAASRLAKCGAVVVSEDGVHGHAPQAIRDACETLDEPWNPVSNLEAKAEKLRKEIEELRPAYQEQLSKAVSGRRATWSGAFAFTGVQLAVFSRLTYFDLDWDTMEPISYFLGSGISVAAFLFMLARGFDFSNRGVDSEVVRKKYIRHPDVVKYFESVEKLERLEKDMEKINTWVRTGKVKRN